jgi:hypothetical protein
LKSESHVRRAFKRIVLVEAGVLGAISALAQILPLIQWQIWLTVFILVGMSSAILVWRSTKSVHLPEELVLDAVAVDGRVVVEVPASHDMLVVANKHARMLYGRDCPTLTEVERWWGRNPWVFAVLRSEWGDYLGYFDILPLTEEGAGLVESGEIEERDIRPDHILSPAEMKDAKTLYLSGLGVRDAGTEVGKARAAKIVRALVSYIEQYYGHDCRRVLALAATPDGERLLKGIGARISCAAEARRDRRNLYEIYVTGELLSQVKARTSGRVTPPKLKMKSLTRQNW